ncbi:uncharacterized protein LOC134722767 [Mytilus trossulus]|uniref:uncharacterized protein LOC134722767 n=1 Tax=Mytilus trossulus TaxID=6551 RepID=UPI003004A0FE
MVENILLVFVLMTFIPFWSEAKVEWEVEKTISEYGQDLELFCTADDYELSSQKSKRWYKGSKQKLLTFNDGSENITKYKASIESNGFRLLIKNLTKNDVNITYMCSYSFSKSENLLLLVKDVFKNDLPEHKGELQERDGKIAVILGIVIFIVIMVILIIVFVILYKRGRLGMVTKICFNRDPQNAPDPYGEVQYDAVPPNETNGNDNQPTNIDPSNGVRYHHVKNDVQPNESNVTDNLETNIAYRFCHHPSNEVPSVDIEATGTSQTSDKSFQPVIATSFSRIGACKTPQPQQSDDAYNETSHAADTERSIVTSPQEEVVISNNDSQISNNDSHISNPTFPNQEEEIIISSAKFPAYSKKRVREQSFTEWSLREPSKQKMASAGFFYKGCNTYAQCFCCGFNKKWRENDDPLNGSSHNDNCLYAQKVNVSSAKDSNSRSPANEETNPKSME